MSEQVDNKKKNVFFEISTTDNWDTAGPSEESPPIAFAALDKLLQKDRFDAAKSIAENFDLIEDFDLTSKDGKIGKKDLERLSKEDYDLGYSASFILYELPKIDTISDLSHEDGLVTKTDLEIYAARKASTFDPSQNPLRMEASLLNLLAIFDGAKNADGVNGSGITKDDLESLAKNDQLSPWIRYTGQYAADHFDKIIQLASECNPKNWDCTSQGKTEEPREAGISLEDLDAILYQKYDRKAEQTESAMHSFTQRSIEGDSDTTFDPKYGNCVSVAAIKAAQTFFGPNPEQVFLDFQENSEGGFSATLRDGTKVTVTQEEFEQATAASGFTGGEAGTHTAHIMWAVIAKNGAQENGFTLEEMLKDLTDGFNLYYGLDLLGLGGYYQTIRNPTDEEIRSMPVAICTGENHAFYCSFGNYDHYGETRPIEKWGDINDATVLKWP